MQVITIRNIKTRSHPETKGLFWYLFAGSRGAINRVKIVSLLKNTPHNAHQLAKELGLDYKTIKHHMQILEKNEIVTKFGIGYSETFFISEFLESNMILFDEIEGKLRNIG